MRRKTLTWTGLAVAAAAALAAPAWAAEAAGGGKAEGTLYFVVSVLTGGFAMAIASAAAAIGQSRAIVAALDGIARQPNAAPRIQIAMIIGLALIESLAIYVLLIALIIFFANPWAKLFGA